MDKQIIFQEQLVEWDEQKEQTNIRKHGISFSTASLIFGDRNRLEIPDMTHSDYEARYKVIGKVGTKKIILAVCTNRDNVVRIISARKATKTERRLYYD